MSDDNENRESEEENEQEEMYPDYEYDSEGDEDEEEDTEETIREMGMHKKMQRIQKTLYEQLSNENERVSLELKEKEEGLKRLRSQREDIGVSLYGVQQQLAKLQMNLENTHTKHNASNEERYEAEEKLDTMKEEYDQKEADLREETRRLRENQRELDALNATLKQVENYNKDMQSEIEVTRRAAYKTEENISNLEKGKKKQDLYIDSLNEEIKRLKQDLKLNDAQIGSQVEETRAAVETLKEASKEMENISFEKKQLIQQWKSSLIGMQRRDEALQATHDTIHQVKEESIVVRTETQGYKQGIAKAQELNETLTATADRIDAEIQFVENQLSSMLQEKERLSERYTMLQKSMQQTDVQTERVELNTKNIEYELAQTTQSLDQVRRERHKLENEISSEMNEQTTVNKAANSLAKAAQKVQDVIHDKEISLASMRNELARIKVDVLNTTAHNSQLRDTLNTLVQDLKDKDTQVEKMELEIRQRNDEIEKKMLRVDRLNKKYEQLTSNMEDENTGPFEATIKNMKKEIVQYQGQNNEKQRNWLNSQTALVNTSAETETINDKNKEKRSKISILEQKRLRLLKNIEHMNQEVKELENGINGMHKDMVKLNQLIAKNSNQQEKLANTNFGMEQEFVEELKELESSSRKMEEQLFQVKSEKQQFLDEIVEIERQAMLWEKKIQLERETQAALDPEVGQAEARGMEKEIHRMKIRLETLLRDQDRMVSEMERALHKRDAIAVRGRGQKNTDVSQASLTKKVSTLQNSLRKSQREISRYEIAIKEKMDAVEAIGLDLERFASAYDQQQEQVNETQKSINDALYDKQRYIDMTARMQRLAKRFDNLVSGKTAVMDPNEEPNIKAERAEAKENLNIVCEVIERLQKEHPHLEEVLSRVRLLAAES